MTFDIRRPHWQPKGMRRLLGVLILAAGILALPGRGEAQDCVDEQDMSLLRERSAFLESVLERGQRPSRWWHWGWMSLTFAATTAQATLAAISEDSENQVAAVVGAVGPFLAMMTHFNGPLPGIDAIDRVRAVDGTDRASLFERLELAERLLLSSDRRERWERGWFPIASSVVLPTGTMLVLGWGYGHTLSGLRVAATNLGGGVARIVTYPRWASRGLREYQERFGGLVCGEAGLPVPVRASVRFSVAPTLGGASLRVDF